jgi:hypothetical protein
MIQNRDIAWRRVTAEGIAIVVSILLAFWIQAWWEDRQERREERVILSAILEEFREKRDVLHSATRINRAILDSTRKLQQLATGPDQQIDAQAVDVLLADLSWVEDEADWFTPTLDGIIASGSLSLISNPALRQQLVSSRRWTETVRLYYRQETDFMFQTFGPYLQVHAYMPPILNVMKNEPGPEAAWSMSGGNIHSGDYDNSTLLSDRQFENILAVRAGRLQSILEIAFPPAEQQIEQIIHLIEGELAQ